MGGALSRCVEVQICNKTQDFTLEKPRTYFYSGHSTVPPSPVVLPSSTDTCQFSNSSLFWGCTGVLVYEATTFTLAIYFSNPLDYNKFAMELGVEVSLSKCHLDRLENIYTHMSRGGTPPSALNENTASHRVALDHSQEPVQLSIGPIKVTATMSNARRSVIRVVVREREESECEAMGKIPGSLKHMREK